MEKENGLVQFGVELRVEVEFREGGLVTRQKLAQRRVVAGVSFNLVQDLHIRERDRFGHSVRRHGRRPSA